MWTAEVVRPAAIWWATESAVSIGMAKPAADCWPGKLTLLPAVFMPMTWPAELASAPPESPETMSALVSIIPCRVSEVIVPPWSPAVMVWFSAVTWPVAGTMAFCPSALPMATTESSVLTVAESPSGTIGRPDAFCSWSRAMSPVTS